MMYIKLAGKTFIKNLRDKISKLVKLPLKKGVETYKEGVKHGRKISSGVGVGCIKCGRKKGVTDLNYAGLNVKREGAFSFPDRIEENILPGNMDRDYLCDSCASKIGLKCKVHGSIYGGFAWGKPPRCKKCDATLNSLRKGILPHDFLWLVPVTEIRMRTGKLIQNGFLAASEALEIHVVTKEVLASTSDRRVRPSLVVKDRILLFLLEFSKDSDVKSCGIYVEDPSSLEKCAGPWFQLCGEKIAKSLNLDNSVDFLWLTSVVWQKTSENGFTPITEKYPANICAIHENRLLTYPNLQLPILDNVESWKIEDDTNSTKMALSLKVDGIPHVLRLQQIYCLRINPIEIMKSVVPTPNTEIGEFDLSYKGVFQGVLYPSQAKQRMLIEKEDGVLYVSFLSTGERMRCSEGFSCGDTFLFISQENHILTAQVAKKNMQIISKSIKKPSQMIDEGDYQWAAFLDKNDPFVPHVLRMSNGRLQIDNGDSVWISKIVGEIKIEPSDEGLYEVMLQWSNGGDLNSLRLLSPESIAYNTVQKLEVARTEVSFDSMNIPDFYQSYSELKMNNLLFVLFSDIIFLNRELNFGRSMSDLAEELLDIDDELFHKKKELKKDTLQKILLLSLNLPRIKQRLEYLANFYPYYLADNENNLVSDAFGDNIARKVMPGEDKRIRAQARQTVRTLQANMQRVLTEIERAVSPTEALFAKEKIRQEWMSRVRRNAANLGQLVLTAGLIVSGGGAFALLAGMFGVRTLGNIANIFEKDRQASAEIKRAAEAVFPWWKLFMNTLVVNIKETSELLYDENIRCMKRDRKLFDSLPSDKRPEAQARIVRALQKRIVDETNNRFVEVMEGTGVRFEAIVSDIERFNSIDVRKRMSDFIRRFYGSGNSFDERNISEMGKQPKKRSKAISKGDNSNSRG